MMTPQLERAHIASYEDGDYLVVYLRMPDGSTRAINWRVEDLVASSGEVSGPLFAPADAALQ